MASVAEAKGTAAREREARKACLSGNYEKGVEILAELFVDTTDTAHIYNQGRCFEQNLRYEQAIGRFQEFLRASPRASRQEKAEANKHIADCQALLDKRAAKESAVRPVALPAEPVGQPEQAVAPPPRKAATHPVPPTSQTRMEVRSTETLHPSGPQGAEGAGLRLAGVLTGSLGAVALVAGVFFNVKANNLTGELEQPSRYTRNKASSRETYITLGWVGYGVGGACLVSGLLLYYLGHSARDKSEVRSSIAVAPMLGANEVGVMLGRGF